MRSLKAPRIGFVYALSLAMALYAGHAAIAPTPAYAGIGKIRAVVIQVLEELGIISDGAYSGVGAHAMLNGGLAHNDTAAAAAAVSRGSLIYGNATPAWDELTIGGVGTVLTSDGTDAAWTSPAHALLDGSVASDTVAQGPTRGSLIYSDATPKWNELAIGGAGTVLSSDGTDVSWQAPVGFTVWIPASAFVAAPSDTSYPGFTTLGGGVSVLAFDGATDEDAIVTLEVPAVYASGSNLTIELVVSAAGTSQSVNFDVEVAGLSGQDLDAGPTYDTAIAHDGTTSATQGVYSSISTANANADVDAIAASEFIMIRVTRDADTDASVVDAYLWGVRISQ